MLNAELGVLARWRGSGHMSLTIPQAATSMQFLPTIRNPGEARSPAETARVCQGQPGNYGLAPI